MKYQLIIRSEEEEPLYSREIAAQLARISLDFLYRCESERFVQPRRLPDGEVGFTASDVRRLARVRRLRYSLGLDLPAVEIVLHLRRQVIELQTYLAEFEKEMEILEQERLQEIQELRYRLSQEARWDD
ncbi:MAG: chaperone modulator CbpM [Candidatus Promineifilaceae bacterium]|nr:chaperone modulator CbpM [Candidatus Promineifilaceae bacterium]